MTKTVSKVKNKITNVSKTTFVPKEKVKMVGSKIVKSKKTDGIALEVTDTINKNGNTSCTTETGTTKKMTESSLIKEQVSRYENTSQSDTSSNREETRREIGKFLNDIDGEFRATYGEVSNVCASVNNADQMDSKTRYTHNTSINNSKTRKEVGNVGKNFTISERQSSKKNYFKNKDSKVKLVGGKIIKTNSKKSTSDQLMHNDNLTSLYEDKQISSTAVDNSTVKSTVKREITDVRSNNDLVNDVAALNADYIDRRISDTDHQQYVNEFSNSNSYIIDESISQSYIIDESVVNATNVEYLTSFTTDESRVDNMTENLILDRSAINYTDMQYSNIVDASIYSDVSYAEATVNNLASFKDMQSYSNAVDKHSSTGIQTYSNTDITPENIERMQLYSNIDTSHYSMHDSEVDNSMLNYQNGQFSSHIDKSLLNNHDMSSYSSVDVYTSDYKNVSASTHSDTYVSDSQDTSIFHIDTSTYLKEPVDKKYADVSDINNQTSVVQSRINADLNHVDSINRTISKNNTHINKFVNETVTDRTDVHIDEQAVHESISVDIVEGKTSSKKRDRTSTVSKEQCICEICTCG